MDSNSSNSSCGSGSLKLTKETGRKSWSELKEVVNNMRRQMTNISCMFPMSVNFRELSDGRNRIFFLSTPPNSFGDTTLLYCDIAADAPESEPHNPIR
jgi:dipeptidyl-peptidase 9